MDWDLQLLIAGRLAFAFFLGGLLGIERTHHQKPAGSRTHALVAVASALFMVISVYGFEDNGFQRDPARLAAQVVAGMGFIGAGTIWKKGSLVKGLTTAATLWVSSALGLAIGVGMYLPAVITTVLALIGLQFYTLKLLLTGKDEWADRQQMIEQLDLASFKVKLEQIMSCPIKINTYNTNDPYVVSFQSERLQQDPFTLTLSIKGRHLSLVLLYIPVALRGQGLARQVVQELLIWGTDHGFQQLNLTAQRELEGIWIKLGFEKVGEGMFRYTLRGGSNPAKNSVQEHLA